MEQTFGGASALVVGGAGFVGSNLVRQLLAADVRRVTVIDNLLSAERENLPADDRVEFREASAADDATIAGIADDYDYIFHLSTYHGNQSSMFDPLADHENNLLPTLKVLERVKNFGRLRKLVYSAAGCAVAEKTYDAAQPTSEDASVSIHMDSPYSISKVVGEMYAAYYHARHGVPAVRARFQNVYGPGEVLGAGRWRGTPATVWRNVVPTFVYRSLQHEALPLEAEGLASRDFIFVEDICDGLMRCALHGAAGDVYNLASGVETRIVDLAKTINTLTGNPAAPILLPRRDWDHSGRRFGSTEKAAAEIGFRARTNLQEGLQRTVAWTRANLSFIEKCMAKHARFMNEAETGQVAARA